MKILKTILVAFAFVSVLASAATPLRPQTIHFPETGPYSVNLAPFRLKATASSGLELSYETLTPAHCKIENRAIWLLKPGICTIKAIQQGNNKFQPAAQEKSFWLKAANAVTDK